MIAWLLLQQILVLFLMMGAGFLLVRLGLLEASASRPLSVITLYLVVPCVIINAFQIDYTDEIRDGFLAAVLAAVLIHVVLFVLCAVFGRILNLNAVEKASLIYSNAGNLIIPLVVAVLGREWVIYASAFLCVQLLILWTHGLSLMQGRLEINWRKLLTNINLIAIVVGLALFLARIQLPAVLTDTLSGIGGMIGPISMIMMGMLLAEVKWREVFSGTRIYVISLLKMIVFPGVVLIGLRLLAKLLPVADSQTIFLISLLAVITPSATTITQMALLYDRDAAYASAINVMTTVVCIVTMPLLVMLYMM